MTLQHLESAALRLAPRNRARLAHALVASLGRMSAPEMERLWVEEAMRRDVEIETGKSKEVSGPAALRRIRKKLA